MASVEESPTSRSIGVLLLSPEARRQYEVLTGLDLTVVMSGDASFSLIGARPATFSQADVDALLAAMPEASDGEQLFARYEQGFVARRISGVGALVTGPIELGEARPEEFPDALTALAAPEALTGIGPDGQRVVAALRLVADPFATMMTQAERARRLLSQITVLNTVGEMVSREPDLDRAVQAILETATLLLDADSGSVMLFAPDDPQVLRIAYAIGLPPEVVESVRVPLGEGISGKVARTGEPVRMRRNERHHLSQQPQARWDAAICVPLRAKDRIIGVLNIRGTSPDREFDNDDIHLAMTFASQAALAIDNTRLLRRLNERLEDAQSELVETNIVLLGIRARLENILRSIPAPVLVAGPDGRLMLINTAAEKALGVPKELALHQKLSKVLQGSKAGQALAEALLGETLVLTPGLTEVSVGSPTRRDLQVHVASISTPEGSYDGSVIVIADVTEIKELADLKSELVSITSHEIKTPITAINLAARTLEGAMDVLEPEERDEIVGIIVNQSVRLKNLVTNLLDLSKIEAGRALDLDLQESDTEEMLRSALEAVEQGLSRREHTFEIEVHPEAASVPMDRSKIEQVVINFLTNAVKYSEPGSVHLVARPEGEGHVRIEICDHGQGIQPDELPTVFDRFQRVGGGEHRRQSGHGLGLHLCKGLVEAHGGRIGVESVVGRGSTFYFVLPRRRATEDSE
jgi:PAS domain S-box-containing protein